MRNDKSRLRGLGQGSRGYPKMLLLVTFVDLALKNFVTDARTYKYLDRLDGKNSNFVDQLLILEDRNPNCYFLTNSWLELALLKGNPNAVEGVHSCDAQLRPADSK